MGVFILQELITFCRIIKKMVKGDVFMALYLESILLSAGLGLCGSFFYLWLMPCAEIDGFINWFNHYTSTDTKML
jgi:hypothetical protein